MTQPNQYTDMITATRKLASPQLCIWFEISDGTPEPMKTDTGKTQFIPTMAYVKYEYKTLATGSQAWEWAPTYVQTKGPRILAKGGTGTEVRWAYSGYPCLDADDLDSFPRWLVQLIMANFPKEPAYRGEEMLHLETSWEKTSYENDPQNYRNYDPI